MHLRSLLTQSGSHDEGTHHLPQAHLAIHQRNEHLPVATTCRNLPHDPCYADMNPADDQFASGALVSRLGEMRRGVLVVGLRTLLLGRSIVRLVAKQGRRDFFGGSAVRIDRVDARHGGHSPGPKRGAGTWDEFLKIHAATLWQCDFYSKKVLTIKGFRDLFLLVFIHVDTRRVFIAPSTFHPNEVLKSANLDVKKASHRSPNTNAFVERFIQTLQQECIDYFVVFGEQHMDHLVSEMVSYYHEERPHQANINAPLTRVQSAVDSGKRKQKKQPSTDVVPISRIECRWRLGGLLKHYYRKAS